MTDHDPYGDPTNADVPVTDATAAMPAAGGPPLPPAPPPTGEPPADRPDRRGWIVAAILGAILLIGIVVLLMDDDDDDDVATDDTTTSTSTTVEETTTSSTTSTTEGSTTTAASESTVPPEACVPSSDPDEPDPTVETLYEAYQLGDRGCAEALATDEAVDTLFAIPGDGEGWTYQGCTETGDGEPIMDCAYTFTGGATHFEVTFSDTDGWLVTDVYQTAD
jgi:cytoskeletal protein RodZ